MSNTKPAPESTDGYLRIFLSFTVPAKKWEHARAVCSFRIDGLAKSGCPIGGKYIDAPPNEAGRIHLAYTVRAEQIKYAELHRDFLVAELDSRFDVRDLDSKIAPAERPFGGDAENALEGFFLRHEREVLRGEKHRWPSAADIEQYRTDLAEAE